jgi:hypothetical protein
MNALGWDEDDEILIEVAGTVVSGIDQPESYNKKWALPLGERKYNNDAFIVIKNKGRDPFIPSKANEETPSAATLSAPALVGDSQSDSG